MNNDIIDILMDAMSRLIQGLKLEIYKQTHYKEILDEAFTKQQNMLHSTNFDAGYFEMVRHHLESCPKKAEEDIERIFMSIEWGEHAPVRNPRLYGMKSKEEKMIEEEKEFADIEKQLDEASKTLKLTISAIRRLHREKSDKFVLPLYSDDYKKFQDLTKQPFNFLSYNGAMFSVDLESKTSDLWDDNTNKSIFQDLWNQRINHYDSVKAKIKNKKDIIKDRQKKIGKAYTKLGKQIDVLKANFEERASKFQNDNYLSFLAMRTSNNIKKIREAEAEAKRKIDILRNKKLTSNPEAFFKRAVTLFLGQTGRDILKDFETLGYGVSSDGAKLAISYLYFLMEIIEKREEKFTAPILTVLSDNEFEFGFKNEKMLKIMAAHMFIHTVTLRKGTVKRKTKPTPPEMRMVHD
jgi:hypothetical protein